MHMGTKSSVRTTWSAVGAAVAIALGAGGIGMTHATTSSGDRPIFTAIEPCRLVDLRPEFQVGSRPSPLGAGETFTIAGWGDVGDCELPSGTSALSLNVTAVGATQPTFLQFFPAGTDRPTRGSNLNPVPGAAPTPNAVNVALSDTGDFSVYNLQGSVDLIVDVVGLYDHHDHDDRYYTKPKTDSNIAAATAALETRIKTDARCPAVDFYPAANTSYTGVVNRTGSGATTLYCGVDLPVGATITGLRAAVLDQSFVNDGRCLLSSIADTANAATLLAQTPFTVGQADTPMILNGTPGTTAIVTANTSYYLACAVDTDVRIRSATVTFAFP